MYLHVYLSIFLSTCMFIYLSIFLSIYLSISLFFWLSRSKCSSCFYILLSILCLYFDFHRGSCRPAAQELMKRLQIRNSSIETLSLSVCCSFCLLFSFLCNLQFLQLDAVYFEKEYHVIKSNTLKGGKF